jgi:predicted transcriptional regulator
MQGVKFELTPKILKEIEDMASLGMLQKDIALCLGITPQFLSEKKGNCHELDEAIKRGNANGLLVASSALRTCIAEKEIAAIIYYLKVKHGWREKEENNDLQIVNAKLDELKADLLQCKQTV